MEGMIVNTSDIGPNPYVTNVTNASMNNRYFRKTIWTGNDIQLTVMCIPVGTDIGAEIHDDVEQFIRVESGTALVKIGPEKNALNQSQRINKGDGVFLPKGLWHNIINMGEIPLRVSSIYGPPEHAKGTIHMTKEDSEKAEKNI